MDTNRYENVIVEGDVWIYIEDYAIEGMEKEVQPDLNNTYKLALQLFNTTAFSWSPDIIDVPMPILLVRTLHHPLFRRIQESTEVILFVWTAVMSSNRDRRRKYLFPQPRRERDSSLAVIYRNLLIIFKMI